MPTAISHEYHGILWCFPDRPFEISIILIFILNIPRHHDRLIIYIYIFMLNTVQVQNSAISTVRAVSPPTFYAPPFARDHVKDARRKGDRAALLHVRQES